MPKIVSYDSRFAFIRRASFQLVLRAGVTGLSRQAVADELGIAPTTLRRLVQPSASMARFAADEVDNRRRRVFTSAARSRSADPLGSLRLTIPRDEEVSTELVALRLTWQPWVEEPAVPTTGDASLAEQYQIADRGFVHRTPTPRAPASGDHEMADRVARWATEQEAVVATAYEALATGGEHGRRDAITELRALVDGLIIARCHGCMPWEQAMAVLDRWSPGPRLGLPG